MKKKAYHTGDASSLTESDSARKVVVYGATNVISESNVSWRRKYLKLDSDTASSKKDRHYVILRSLSFATASVGFAYFANQVRMGHYKTYAYPLLITATICTLLHVSGPRLENAKLSSSPPFYAASSTILFLQRLKVSTHTSLLVVLIAILPTLGYGYHKLSKRLSEHSILFMDAEFQKHLANNYGKISLMAMCFFLIPVSKHSILLQAVRIDPIQAISLHIWAGYLAYSLAILHGVSYVLIWTELEHESLWDKLFPSWDCWSHLSEYEKICHKTVINFLGACAILCLVLLTATSLHWVRRKHYQIFYFCHLIFGCFFTVALLMHYRKTILYLSPSICYYFASTVPTLCQGWIQGWFGGARIESAKPLVDSGNCTEVSIRVDHRWVVGQKSNVVARHVRICVPSISRHIWHPFSVFSPPGQPDRLNFIFRSYGPFTQSLADELSAVALGKMNETEASNEGYTYPTILVDGLHAIPDRLKQALDHEIVCMVAGGIGIVSYLDMLLQLQSMQTDGQLKKVVLHWMCRDEGLIEYVSMTHFTKLDKGEKGSSPWMDVQIVIHHTSTTEGLHVEGAAVVTELPTVVLSLVDRPSSKGIPLIPSLFSRVYNQSFLDNFVCCVIFSLISWGCLSIIFSFYEKYSDKHGILYHRSYVFFALVLYVMIASFCILALVQWLRGSDKSFAEKEGDLYQEGGNSPQSSVLDSNDGLSSGTASDLDLAESNLSIDDSEKDPYLSEGSTTFEIVHLKGRPVIGKLLSESLHFSDKLGVFVCGPESLLKSVKDTAEGGHLCSGKFAIYEEIFDV